MKATVDGWIRADPKTAEWHEDTARRAKETARNYSRLLHLYWPFRYAHQIRKPGYGIGCLPTLAEVQDVFGTTVLSAGATVPRVDDQHIRRSH